MPLRLSTNRLRSLWPIPERDFTSKLKLVVICLFDANIPGDDMENFKGGTTGGSILDGMLRVGDNIEVCRYYQQGRGRQDDLRLYCVALCGQECPAICRTRWTHRCFNAR